MRYAALALMACLAGCSLTSSGSGECVNDSQCGGDVCANDMQCTAKSSVRALVVKWTVEGVAADATSCNAHPNLFVQFDGTDFGDRLRFEPVPCVEGQFNVDKLPKRYQQVELGIMGGNGGSGDVMGIDAVSAQVQFDLIR